MSKWSHWLVCIVHSKLSSSSVHELCSSKNEKSWTFFLIYSFLSNFIPFSWLLAIDQTPRMCPVEIRLRFLDMRTGENIHNSMKWYTSTVIGRKPTCFDGFAFSFAWWQNIQAANRFLIVQRKGNKKGIWMASSTAKLREFSYIPCPLCLCRLFWLVSMVSHQPMKDYLAHCLANGRQWTYAWLASLSPKQ